MGQKDRRQQLYGRITCDFTQTLQWHACSFTNVGYTLARTRQERSAAKYICGSIRKVKKMKKYLCASIATIMIAAALALLGLILFYPKHVNQKAAAAREAGSPEYVLMVNADGIDVAEGGAH